MAFRPMLLLLATFLLVTTGVSSSSEGELVKGTSSSKVLAPAPVPTIPVKATPPPPPVKPPTTTPPPVKPPTTTPPSVSPPKTSPPPPVSPPKTSPPLPVTPPKTTPTPPVSPPKTIPPPVSPPLPPVRTKKDCLPLCGVRCQLHSRKNVCVRACTTCCDRCKCVPPGTYGNRELCGKCYTDMTTRNNKPKCP